MPTSATTRRILNIIQIVVLVAVVGLVTWLIALRFGKAPPPPSVITQAVSSMMPKHTPSPKSKNAYLSKNDPSVKVEDLGPDCAAEENANRARCVAAKAGRQPWKIIDVHEHGKGEEEAVRLLKVMDQLGIQRVLLMGSTTYTLTLNPMYGFEGFKENNEALLAIKKKWPHRFSAFVTFDPLEEGNLELLKDYVSRGADGLKLYLGHGEKTGKGPFHVMPLDDARMEPIWAWAEEIQLPIVCHVNLNKYWDELVRVLEKHPYLRMNIPHFGLHKNSAQRLARLSWLLKRYPNLYTDISFGFYTFQIEGFEQLGRWRTRSREWLTEHRNKVLFASDMVLEPSKDDPYIVNTLRSYMQFLENVKWRFFLVPDHTMHGMGLDDETLTWIYEKAPAAFLNLDDQGNLPDRERGVVPRFEKVPLPPLDPATIPPLTAKKVAGKPTPAKGEEKR